MFVDSTLKFCQDLAITGTAATRLVGDVIDLGTVSQDYGDTSRPMYLVIQVTDAVVSAGDATLQFILATDAQAAITVDGTETRHITTGVIGKADLVVGRQLVGPLPFVFPEYQRYLGLLVVTGTATTTAGSITAFLTVDPQTWKAYPEGNN